MKHTVVVVYDERCRGAGHGEQREVKRWQGGGLRGRALFKPRQQLRQPSAAHRPVPSTSRAHLPTPLTFTSSLPLRPFVIFVIQYNIPKDINPLSAADVYSRQIYSFKRRL
jgi:hypothetical protein